MAIRGVLPPLSDGHSSDEEDSWDRLDESADGPSIQEDDYLTLERVKEFEEKVHTEWQKPFGKQEMCLIHPKCPCLGFIDGGFTADFDAGR